MIELQKLIEHWQEAAAREWLKVRECSRVEGKYIHTGEYRRLQKCIKEARLLLKKTREQQP